MKNNLKEIISATILVGLLIALINPFHAWMPNMIQLTLIASTVAAFGVFTIFVLREDAQDEREVVHRMNAGRAAFLSGAFVIILGIIIQGLFYTVDTWLVAALVIMTIVKIGVRLYSDINA